MITQGQAIANEVELKKLRLELAKYKAAFQALKEANDKILVRAGDLKDPVKTELFEATKKAENLLNGK